MEQDGKRWIGKRVYIILKNNRQYSGTIINQTETAFELRDKFGLHVLIAFDDVSLLQEQKAKGEE